MLGFIGVVEVDHVMDFPRSVPVASPLPGWAPVLGSKRWHGLRMAESWPQAVPGALRMGSPGSGSGFRVLAKTTQDLRM